MNQYSNIELAIELLLIESGIQQDGDTSEAVSARINTILHALEDRFVASELNTVEQWMYDFIDMPATWAAIIRGTTHIGCTHSAAIPKVLEYMRELCK